MAKSDKATSVDVVIIGAGIAGLWVFNHLKSQGYDALLLERSEIGGGQTIAAQGIIHSGLKFSLAGKVNALAKSISQMPERWRAALNGQGDVDLSAAQISALSQQLFIPSGFLGDLTTLITQKTLGNNVQSIPKMDWSAEIKDSGFDGSVISMDEPVLDVPSVIRALASPYKNCICKIDDTDPFKFLERHHINAKRVIFTCASSNEGIAKAHKHDEGLATQHRPLLQAMVKNAPFSLFAHLVGKTDKPVVSITTHTTDDGALIWYLGGGVAERSKTSAREAVYQDTLKAFKKYLPNVNLSNVEWSVLPIDRVEGKSNTDGWMPNTPTVHTTTGALYCWPTKLTFAPLLGDMVMKDLEQNNILPSQNNSDFSFLDTVDYAQTPWDKAQWKKFN